MPTRRHLPLAAALLALLASGCTDQRPDPTGPDMEPRTSSGYIVSVNVSCTTPVPVGGQGQCWAYAWDSNGNYTNQSFFALWGSTNGSVLGVGPFGATTGYSNGSAQAYAVVNGVWGWSNTVQVYAPTPPAVSRVEVIPSSVSLGVGQNRTLTARAYDASGNQLSGQTFSWSSSASSVASVTSSGQVTAQALGSATITATTGGVSGTSSVSVHPIFTVGISGESTVKPNHNCSWFADVSGGSAPYSYSWYVPYANGSSVYEPSSWTGSSSSNFTVNLTVTDANGVRVGSSMPVTVSSSLPAFWECML